MAIYKNREVQVIGPNPQLTTPETVSIRYAVAGTTEIVPFGAVRYTEQEKKDLIKQYPARFNDVETITDEDIKAVRLGVAPSFDTSAKEAAESKVQHQKQNEYTQKQNEKLEEEAKKDLDKKLNANEPVNTSKSIFSPSVKK